MQKYDKQDDKPWWHYGYVWLMLSGPFAVIVASVITVNLALQSPDLVVEDYYRKGIEINKTLRDAKHSPAVDARNHAATIGMEAER